MRPEKRKLPVGNVISHVTICVSDLENSLPFYEGFGLETFGPTVDGQQFLRSTGALNSTTSWETLVLLREDKNMPRRNDVAVAGIGTRFCFYTDSIDREVKRLASLGYNPVAAPLKEGLEEIAAYEDPDGLTVYFVSFRGILVTPYMKVMSWWMDRRPPVPFHFNINAVDIDPVLPMFEKLGFKTFIDCPGENVKYSLFRAFGRDPEDYLVKHYR
jgi:catechol 2,3-dioxygenase-like lactoylglutathione lyase family enzyme